MSAPGSRTWYVLSVVDRLGVEAVTGEPSMDGLTWAMKAAATGDRERFERVVRALVPEELQQQVRILAEQTVFEELRCRAVLATNPSKSRMPFPWDAWHVEIRMMLGLLLGERGGAGPRVALAP